MTEINRQLAQPERTVPRDQLVSASQRTPSLQGSFRAVSKLVVLRHDGIGGGRVHTVLERLW